MVCVRESGTRFHDQRRGHHRLCRRNEARILLCIELTSGNIRWQAERHVDNLLVSDGDVVIGIKTEHALYGTAWNMTDGSRRWQRKINTFGSGLMLVDDVVVVGALPTPMTLSVEHGSNHDAFQVSPMMDISMSLAVTGEYILARSARLLQCFHRSTAELIWTEPLIYGLAAEAWFVTDTHVLVAENDSTAVQSAGLIRGYDISTGERAFEVRPVDTDGQPLPVASFAIGEGSIYCATESGLVLFPAGNDAFAVTPNPLAGNQYSNDDLGFSYTWSEDWHLYGTDAALPDGWAFISDKYPGYVFQYVTESMDDQADLEDYPPLNLAQLVETTKPLDAIKLPFDPPADAEVTAARFHLASPAEGLTSSGVRIRLPLADGQALVFDASSWVEDSAEMLEGFADFFVQLQRDGID